VVGNLEFVFEVRVFVLEHFGFLDDAFCFDFVLLLVDFLVEAVLLQGQDVDVPAQLLHLLLLYLHLLLELQLRVEQLVVHPLQTHRRTLARTHPCQIRLLQHTDPATELSD
jgi:hypothetical protein